MSNFHVQSQRLLRITTMIVMQPLPCTTLSAQAVAAAVGTAAVLLPPPQPLLLLLVQRLPDRRWCSV